MSISKIQSIAALAADAGNFDKLVETFVAHVQLLAQDGLTLSEVGQIFGELIWLLVHAAEELEGASGEDKKAAVLTAVGYVFDIIAPYIPLGWLAPFRKFVTPSVRQIVLLVASGLVEVIVSKMNATPATATK